MSMRATSLQATNVLAINREIDSKYDAVLAVRDKLVEIEKVAGLDIEQLLTDLQNAQDFTGISVVAGETAGWDAETKTITVPTLKGDQGIQGPVGATGATGATGAKGDRGLTGAAGANGRDGRDGTNGTDGINGIDGIDGKDLTVEQITYDGNTGKFVWQFSDGTSYTTPDLRGPKGDVGDKGDKGDTGLGVHHIKGTSTTNSTGTFGVTPFRDTYTLYGDAAETINLGHFTVANGVSEGMSMEVYDANANGIVDNSERLGGELPSHYVNIVGDQDIGGNKTFAGNVTVQGDLVVNGESTTVNTTTVEVEDNLLVINKGEVGNGVTAGEAGILVDRGTATDYKFVWEETSQAFKIGEIGGLQKVATREDAPIDKGIATWNDATNKFNTTLDVKVNSIQLNGGSGVEGTLSWNADEGTADLELPGGSTLQIGQENVRLVRNSTASTITNGTVCMFAGTIGNSGRIKVKPFTGGFDEAMYVYGVATQDIAAGADGLITIEGKVRGIDTTGASVGETWVDEDILYAKPGDNGRLTKVVPAVTELRMPVASVIKAHTNGTLEIRFTPINENQFEPRNANIQTHIANTSNPHGVTKAQVGLGNVDNTSDVNKPISTATQTELDLKANRIDVDDLFTDASNLGYDDTFTDMRVADVQAALAHLGEESKYWSNIHSAVRLFGGIIQDNGDGTVRVANGGGLFKKEASSVEGVPAGECEPMQLNAAQGGKLFYETWEAAENVQLTNNAYNYIFIVWDHTFDNGDGSFGKARVIASTNFYLQDWESEISYYNFKAAHPELTLPARRSGMLHGFTVGRVYKMDNEITIRVCGTNGWNFNKRVQLFGEEFFPVIRARGLDIQTIPNTLQFNVTEGVMWAEMANRFTVRAFEMDKGDTFTSWYQHTAETTALTLAQIQSTYPTGIANRKYDILYSSTDTKYYRLNPSNNTWGEVLDYINSKVSISTHPANLSVLETLAPTGYVNNSEGTDYVVLQLQATDSFYRYNPNAALGNRWELFGDKSTVHPYVTVAFLGDVAGMNAEYPTGFNDVINVIVGCADGMYYEYSGVSGQSGWKRVQGYIEKNGWLRFYKQSAVDALRYNDSTNNKLVDLENGMYGVAWIYMVHDNSCHVVYGQGAYTSEEAKQAALPSPLPGILAAYSTLVGKMTFSRGATTFENAESPFIEKFISSGVSLHNDLAGLDGGNSTQNKYYHLDELAYNLVNTFADVVDVSPEGDLGIVGDYSGANALFSGNLTVGGTTSGITKAMVGLANAENTADNVKNVLSATKWTTSRLITLGGNATGSVNIDGNSDVTLTVNVVDDSHNHAFENLTGKPTTVAEYGITDVYTKTQTDSNISTAVSTSIGTKVTKNADIVAGTGTKITYDAKGLVTGSASLDAEDIPSLDVSKITTGTLPVNMGGTGTTTSTGTGNVVLSSSPTLATPNIGVAIGTSFNNITGLSLTTPLVAGTAAVGTDTTVARADHVHPVQTSVTGNAGTATALQTARTINGVSFDGSTDITITDNSKQDTLVSGTNIKTINSQSVLGSGDLKIEDTLGTAIDSANTTNIGTSTTSDIVHITGTTTITSFGTAYIAGIRRTLIFDGALILTHNATSLILPTGKDITTSAGDSAVFVCEDNTFGYWRCISYTRANGTPLTISKAILRYVDPYYFSSGVGTSGITVATSYSLFPTANDTITLSVGTYRVNIVASVTVATSTVSGTLLLNPRGAGTAVGTIYGITNSTITNGGASNQFFTSSTALGTAFTVSAASAVAGRVYTVYGEYIVNVTTAGTFIPAYQFSATLTSGVVTLNAGNNIIIDNITDTSVTTFGGWN